MTVITISGNVIGNGPVEAQLDGGGWTTIGSTSGKAFTGTLNVGAAAGGVLEVRLVNDNSISASLDFFGVGDVYVIAGQSNASGFGGGPRQKSDSNPGAGKFSNSYRWMRLWDDTDSPDAQVDSVSDDGSTGTQGGTYWPLVADHILDNETIPVGFVSCAKGGTMISEWLPGADHQDRTTLYGSMIYRALQVNGGVKAVLWHQGESDAINATAQADYNSRLDTIANAINTDLGVSLVAAKIHTWNDIFVPGPGAIAAINNAIDDAWGDNANVLAGPDFGNPNIDTDLHFLTTQALIEAAAARWWAALAAAFYP